MIQGLVSTVVPVRNRPERLAEAIESVLGQTHRPIEVVVVDDESTDETPRIAEEYAERYPGVVFALRSGRRRGPGGAREVGRRVVRGEFVQYLDSDDLLVPRKFEWQVAGLRERPECGMSYGVTEWRDRSGRSIPPPGPCGRVVVDDPLPALLLGRLWDTPAPLYRRELIDAGGPWQPRWHEEDWEYDCRLAALGIRLHYMPYVVAIVRRLGEGHVSGGGAPIRRSLRDRAWARQRVLQHARRAGCSDSDIAPAARAIFLLGRQCGAAGLETESRDLVEMARGLSERADVRWYSRAGRWIGWRGAGVLAAAIDRVRALARRA